MVYDLLLVEINEPSLSSSQHCFDYSILSEDETPIRKGRFWGNQVQLRMTQVAEGNYSLRLFMDGGFYQDLNFEKKSSSLPAYS